MIDSEVLLRVGVIALVTSLIRFLPFMIWNGKRKIPASIGKFSRMLPYAVMGMLVIYCLKDVSIGNISDFLPEIISCLLVVVLYIWKRNTLISIISGTLCYMLLIQVVFVKA